MINDTPLSYGSVTRFFHISIAFLMISLLIVGFLLGNNLIPTESANTVRMIHKSTGTLVLILAVLRVLWRMRQPTPSLSHIPMWQQWLAWINIKFLYVCMFVFPLSGIGMSLWGGHSISIYNLLTIPAFAEKNGEIAGFLYKTHCLFGYLILISLSLHILGALYHHFIIKDSVLKRMFSSSLN